MVFDVTAAAVGIFELINILCFMGTLKVCYDSEIRLMLISLTDMTKENKK